MKRLCSAASGVVMGMAVVLPGIGCTPAPVSCPSLGFAPQTDWVATSIRATNTACTTARALATTGKHGPLTFSAYAFNCRGRPVLPMGLANIAYSCFGPGGRTVTWRLYGGSH